MKAEDLVALLNNIPEGANPYLYAAGALRQAFFPHETKRIYIQLWKALGILLAVNIHICAVILLGKWREGAMYLWKRKETPRGQLLVPNTSLTFTIFAGLFCAASQPYIWLTIRMLEAEKILPVAFKAQNNCMVLVWLFLVLAVLSELHALCLMTFLTALPTSSTGAFAWVSKIKARWLNLSFLVLYGFVIISLVVTFTVAEVYWNRLIDIAYRIQEYLLSESVGWDGVTNQVEIDRSLALSMLGQLVSHTEHFRTGSQIGFSILSACNLLVLWLYVPCGIRYTLLLGSQIHSDKERRQRDVARIRDEHNDSLATTYKLMLLKTILIFTAGTPSLVGAGWAAANLEEVLQNSNSYFAVNMLPLGGFAFLGTLALLVLLWITWTAKVRNGFLTFGRSSNEKRSSADLPLDINVDIETVTLAENHQLRTTKTNESNKSFINEV